METTTTMTRPASRQDKREAIEVRVDCSGAAVTCCLCVGWSNCVTVLVFGALPVETATADDRNVFLRVRPPLPANTNAFFS